jgi:AAA+ superfamily predicted ATPase
MAVASGVERSGDDIVRQDIRFNEKNILTSLEEDVGKRFSEGVKGVFKMKKEIEFQDYAYEQGSDWAKQVGTIKRNVDYFRFLRTQYESNRIRIRDITKLIVASEAAKMGSSKKISPDMLKNLAQEKNSLELENREKQDKIEMEASDMLPHFFILHGDPGVGKTIWGSALADLLNYTLYKIDISDQKNMWYGNTEDNCSKLLNFLKSSQECVFIMDEVDKMLSSGDSPSTHQVDKAIVAKLLEFFGNKSNDEIFIKNKVYFIMTTNYIDDVSIALKARSDVKEFVTRPKSVEAYEAILRSSIKNLRPRFPKAAIDSINWGVVAKVLSKKEVDFRQLEQMMEISFKADVTWQQTMEMFSAGMIDSLGDMQGLGMPLTIENMLEVCDLVASGESHGVMEVIGERTKKVKAMMEPYRTGQKKFDTKPITNPNTKQTKDVLQFPEDITKIMRGEGASKDVPSSQTSPEGWEYTKTIDPETGTARVDLKPKVNPAEEMRQLQDTGFEEKPLMEVEPERQKQTKEEAPSKKKKEDVAQNQDIDKKQDQQTAQKEKISSSTDYYFDYLQKMGMIQDNKIVATQKSNNGKPQEIVTAKEKPLTSKVEDGSIDDLASKGIYYFGGLLIAPINNRAKPQQLRSFNREL